MSENILSIIPTDPRWQPEPGAADRDRTLLAQLAPNPDRTDDELTADWHETITVVDCGANLEEITCPLCNAAINTEWWAELIEERYDDGFDDLTATVPCCKRRTTLDKLNYNWPCGFARFELAVWNPGRDWLTDQELSILAQALGHPVHQILAHI